MIQLQSILFPDKEVCEIPELYYHLKENRIDYNGYFNLFYLEKRKKYTYIENLKIFIRLAGYQRLVIVHDDMDIKDINLEPEIYKEYLIDLPYKEYENGCFWFALYGENCELEKHISGYYVTEPIEYSPRKINIGVDICTFKREEYIVRNIKQLKEKILSNPDLDVSSHVCIYIVDNGQTLHEHGAVQWLVQECNSKVYVIPNMNAGGTGGFTRGMLEVLKNREEKEFTHIVLMDDDAVVEPDLLVRIYGFLSTVKDAWKDITIGGALFREDYPYLLLCAGEWWKKGKTVNTNSNLDLRELKVSSSEYLTVTGNEYDGRYSGWWCCCYSLNVVRDDNLPIPLFIHRDDIEFGIRNAKYGITFLNGVGVWHRGFEYSIDPNSYYDTRNTLIELALNKEDGKKLIAIKMVLRALALAAFRYTYKEAHLTYRGILDFLKGPKWLYCQKPEELNDEIRAMACRMYPVEHLKKYITEDEYASVKKQIRDYQKKCRLDNLGEEKILKTTSTIFHYLTFNGWLLPTRQQHIKVISTVDTPFSVFREKKVVWFERGNGKVYLAEKQYKEFLLILWLSIKSIVILGISFTKVAADYKKHISEITTKTAWTKYLDLN